LKIELILLIQKQQEQELLRYKIYYVGRDDG
jgi:hypothetical protein